MKNSKSMKKQKIGKGRFTINVLLALAISLVVNFYYFVFIILSSTNTQAKFPKHPMFEKSPEFIACEMMFYFAVAFVILLIFSSKLDEKKIRSGSYPKRLLKTIIVALALYLAAPIMNWHGEIGVMLMSHRIFNPMVILKFSFIIVVVALYGKIYELIIMQQNITVENERLKTENLRSRYDVLINQMNPHFFFNSLNSLSMLVRENKNDDALNYIDRLSDTFRYIIQSGSSSMTTLRDEIAFLDAYKYLLEIRYEGKLFVDVEVSENDMDKRLPSLTLQPLVENAVKHNVITKAKPLHITIYSDGNNIYVSNPLQPKIDNSERGTGIGLRNIASRYELLMNKDITVIDDGKTFTVKMPIAEHNDK